MNLKLRATISPARTGPAPRQSRGVAVLPTVAGLLVLLVPCVPVLLGIPLFDRLDAGSLSHPWLLIAATLIALVPRHVEQTRAAAMPQPQTTEPQP